VNTKPQLYLHIGHPKAGSTTVQEFLFKNWRRLVANGFDLPTATLGISEEMSPPGNPIAFFIAMQEKQDTTPLVDWVEKAAQRSSKLLMSAECLSGWYWHKPFVEISEHIDIHVIYYVRRQDEILLSAWRQWGIKRGLSLSNFIEKRLENRQPDFNNSILPWINNVRLSSIYIRFVDPRFLWQGSLIQDLSRKLNLRFEDLEPVSRQNESIDARLLLYLSERPELFSSIHDDSLFSLLSNTRGVGPRMRLHLTETQFSQIHDAFEPANQKLLAAYHPEMQGTPVITRETAPISDTNQLFDATFQKEYLKDCLEQISDSNDPRILQLRKEVGLA